MITYVKGDATYPVGDGTKFIIHINNDVNAWGAGFTGALSKRWQRPEKLFRSLGGGKDLLGETQFIQVETDIWVVNMIAQHGIGQKHGPPIRYEALIKCLKRASSFAKSMNGTIHAPKIGAGLAGGEWAAIVKIIEEHVQVPIFIYEL